MPAGDEQRGSRRGRCSSQTCGQHEHADPAERDRDRGREPLRRVEPADLERGSRPPRRSRRRRARPAASRPRGSAGRSACSCRRSAGRRRRGRCGARAAASARDGQNRWYSAARAEHERDGRAVDDRRARPACRGLGQRARTRPRAARRRGTRAGGSLRGSADGRHGRARRGAVRGQRHPGKKRGRARRRARSSTPPRRC